MHVPLSLTSKYGSRVLLAMCTGYFWIASLYLIKTSDHNNYKLLSTEKKRSAFVSFVNLHVKHTMVTVETLATL